MKPTSSHRVVTSSGSFLRRSTTGIQALNTSDPSPVPLSETNFEDIPDPTACEPVGAATTDAVLQPLLRTLPPASTRQGVRWRRRTALSISAAWLWGHGLVYGVRQDLATLPLGYLAVQVLLPFAVAVLALSVALSKGEYGLGPRVRSVLLLALLAPASFWLAAVATPLPRLVDADSAFLLSAFVCLDLTIAWIAVPLVAAAVSLRHSFPAAAAWRSALVGGACGLFCGATMNLHCPNVDPWHLTLGHGVPILLASVVGAFILARWTRS